MTFCSSSKVAVFSLLTIDVDLCLNMSEDLNQIYCRRSLDMNTKVQTRISTNGYSPSIYGNKIIWNTKNNGVVGIMLYDIPTKKVSTIHVDVEPYSISIYGNRIVWNDMQNGMFTGMYDFVLSLIHI